MRIGRFVEVLEIVPDETPGLGLDGDAQRTQQGSCPPVVGPRVDRADQARGRSAAYAS